MKKLFVLLGILLITSGVNVLTAQTIGTTKTEEFKADFEKKKDIAAYMDYEGPKKYIQILKCGIGEEVYEMYPELKEKRVGLGVANIVLEYLDNLNRLEFTEDKIYDDESEWSLKVDNYDFKLDTISNYRFNVCFENTIEPGYYTEKLLHSKIAGCIPIYYADKQINRDFNSESFINLIDFKTIEDFVSHIIKIEETPSLMKEINAQPLFLTPQTPIIAFKEIRNKIKSIL